ncbi:MAG: nuclear transport factor 2 family protein [Crocosphaera sp.]|nr:nuclear transport factor 2 family protein [Crocosphaera sp.]
MNTTELLIVEAMLAALENGDREGFLATQTADVVWDVSGNEAPSSPNDLRDTEAIPFAGNWYGTVGISETVGDFFDQFQGSLEIVDFETLDFFQNGDRVIARVNLEANVVENGLDFEQDLAFIIDLEESPAGDKLIQSVELVYNSYDVASAFTGNEPSPESIALDAINPLEGVALSVNPDADSAASAEVVRIAYEALQQGDVAAFINQHTEDSSTVLDADPAVLGTGNVWQGREGLEELLTEVVPSSNFIIRVVNPTDIIATGDRVVVVTDWENTNTATGLNGSFTLTEFLTVNEEGLITNGQYVFDTHIPASMITGRPFFQASNEINGTAGRDVMTGTELNDIIVGGGGSDRIDISSLGGDLDRLVYLSARDMGDVVTGFITGEDQIDVSGLFTEAGITVESYEEAISQGYLGFGSRGSSAVVLFDENGLQPGRGRAIASIAGVSISDLDSAENFIVTDSIV